MLKTNILNRFSIAAFAVLLLLAGLTGKLFAQTLNTGYSSDDPLQKGMLVTEKPEDPTKLIPVTRDNVDKLKGVVVQQNDSPVTLSSEGQNVFVSSSGNYDVLISDENGPIAKGDYISISSLAGVGMKADESVGVVVGRAIGEFDGKNNSVGSTVDPYGKTVNFARVQVAVDISRNPYRKEPNSNTIPKLLQKVSVNLAGKPVSTSKIWMATAIFLVTAFITGVMLYSGARNSLIAVGRNPLSKGAIIKGLIQVVVFSLVVFITGMFGVYLLLKL